jgi:hypothetical protein
MSFLRSLDTPVYLGSAALRWDLCPREQVSHASQLELEGAHPQVNRLKLR